MIDIQLPIETSVDNEGVGHSYSLGFHWMLLGVHEFPEILVVEVGHSSFTICLHKHKFIFSSTLLSRFKNVLFL